MNYLLIALIANFLNSIAVLIDKFLLTKTIKDPLIYIFYFSLVSLISLIFLPFIPKPDNNVVILGSASTILWTIGAYLMFYALKVGMVQRVIPVIGTLTTLFLLFLSFRQNNIDLNELWAIGFLLAGLVFLNLGYFKGEIKKSEFFLTILSSIFFAFSYYILKQAFIRADFISVFIWSKPILIALGVGLFIIPTLRKRITAFKISHASIGKGGLLFAFGQISAGISELLIIFSISLANPAVVNSLQGTKYVFLLIFALILSKKYPLIFTKSKSKILMLLKIMGILSIFLGLYTLSSQKSAQNINLGVTFSTKYAQHLNLNPTQIFTRMLDELNIKYVRLPIYWDSVEDFPLSYDFSYYDNLFTIARKKEVKIIPVLGYKVPRWPECYAPEWVSKTTREDRERRILNLVKETAEHFKHYENIIAWQIENEPFFDWGICDKVNTRTIDLLKKEVEIVRKADQRPIIINDSGELTSWIEPVKLGDILGISLYRRVWSELFGFTDYPFPPAFYSLKNQLVRLITQKDGETIITELQSEPWTPDRKGILNFTQSELSSLLPPEKLNEYLEYAKQTGFSQIYLWGVEWWYYMETHGDSRYLEKAEKLFTQEP